MSLRSNVLEVAPASFWNGMSIGVMTTRAAQERNSLKTVEHYTSNSAESIEAVINNATQGLEFVVGQKHVLYNGKMQQKVFFFLKRDVGSSASFDYPRAILSLADKEAGTIFIPNLGKHYVIHYANTGLTDSRTEIIVIEM